MKRSYHGGWVLSLAMVGVALTSGCGSSGDSVRADEASAVEGGGAVATNSDRSTAQTQCAGFCADQATSLSLQDVQQIIGQVSAEAEARNLPGTAAVVDRVGNVLAVYQMNTADRLVSVSSSVDGSPPIIGGLEAVNIIPSTLAAIAKAQTGAYLSTEGNAFSTRTASQIIQENFNPGEINQPSGPLFGVQFSQLPCGDFSRRAVAGEAPGPGPFRSPLGLSADPGGFPLYKSGTPVGGIGFIGDGVYGLDKQISGFDRNADEVVALAGTVGFAAPLDRRADVITAAGKTLRFSDWSISELLTDASDVLDLADLIATGVGELVTVTGYFLAPEIKPGTAFGYPDSGIAPAPTGAFVGPSGLDLDAFIFVDADGQNRYPVKSGLDSPGGKPSSALSAAEVRVILEEALVVAARTRAQIRRPLGTQARVTISLVDSSGEILGIVRTRDGPVFGADVSIQKARTAVFFSSTGQSVSSSPADTLRSLPSPQYLAPVENPAAIATDIPSSLVAGLLETSPLVLPSISFEDYLRELQRFLGISDALESMGPISAFADRSGGNLSRPHYPDGVAANPPGPLSKPSGEWSVFSVGLQSDLIYNALIQHVAHVALEGAIPDVGLSCLGNSGFDPDALFLQQVEVPGLANGIQIFPGSVPIFRGETLVGGIGVSGDGVDQDDMISFLGVHGASVALEGALGNAPVSIRADQIELPDDLQRLRYVSCPQSPFIDSDGDNVCDGL